jgi:small subunit ribosomal protein S9
MAKPEMIANAVARRKTSRARVRLYPGTGQIEVNGMPVNEYFKRDTLEMIIQQPIELTQVSGKYDIIASLDGGGLSGQAGALRHGITQVLIAVNPQLRKILKSSGFITRDPRMKERKKYGQRGARARYQFSKR